jgi:hypothetical protein
MVMHPLYALPKVFSYAPLTTTISPQGASEIKDGTFGDYIKMAVAGRGA